MCACVCVCICVCTCMWRQAWMSAAFPLFCYGFWQLHSKYCIYTISTLHSLLQLLPNPAHSLSTSLPLHFNYYLEGVSHWTGSSSVWPKSPKDLTVMITDVHLVLSNGCWGSGRHFTNCTVFLQPPNIKSFKCENDKKCAFIAAYTIHSLFQMLLHTWPFSGRDNIEGNKGRQVSKSCK